jgi:hypothetical protein
VVLIGIGTFVAEGMSGAPQRSSKPLGALRTFSIAQASDVSEALELRCSFDS